MYPPSQLVWHYFLVSPNPKRKANFYVRKQLTPILPLTRSFYNHKCYGMFKTTSIKSLIAMPLWHV